MKAYRYRNESGCYYILIEEDDGDKRIALIGRESIIEHLTELKESPSGSSRLMFGGGSSIPYKDADGNLVESWIEL
jgi:hypothetical protein